MAKMLTAKSVEHAKAGKTRREIPDGGTGLYLVVQPSGARSWAYRYRFHRDPRKLTLGTYPLVPLVDTRDTAGRVIVKGARTLAAQAREAVEAGRDPAAEKSASDSDGPDRDLFPNALRQFIERYAKPKNRRWQDSAALLGLRPDPANGELVIIDGGIADKWKARRIQEINKRDIIDLLDGIVDRGSPVTANRVFAALRKFFNWQISRDALTHSPCSGLKPPTAEKSRDRVLSNDEIRWLWQASENVGHPFGPIAQLLLVTGQRKSEVGGMSDTELDTAKALWSLPGTRTKNKRAHTVPLSGMALELIEGAPRISSEAGLLFTTTGTTPVSGFSKGKDELDAAMLAVARAEKPDAKIAPWHLHDLRHSLKTWMQEARIAKDVRDAVQNHHTKDMDAQYGHYTFADEKRDALTAWARHLDAVITGKSAKVIKLRA